LIYGVCNLSIVPLRSQESDRSEMTSQLLFGDHFEVLEKQKNWSKIKLAFDDYEGFIDNKQYVEITKEEFTKRSNSVPIYSGDIIEYLSNSKNELTTIPLGTTLPFYSDGKLQINTAVYLYEGKIISAQQTKNNILQIAFTYLNTPYLWGGKTPFGIDCSGFTQMVYKLCGHTLFRDVKQQATQGEVLSFIEESEPGDLAFFDNEEGEIIHVGIILNDHNIIHSFGKVRIDNLDHSGIFNTDLQKHTHQLRMIRKMIL
jgi:hypothetical protein